MRTIWIVGGVVVGVLLALTTAAFFIGKTYRDAITAQCTGDDAVDAIAGCTALIRSNFTTTASIAAARSNRGNAYTKKHLYDQAIADYSKAIEIDPELAIAYGNRGLSYARKRLEDGAIRDFTKVIELSPITPPPSTIAAWPTAERAFTTRRSPISLRRWR